MVDGIGFVVRISFHIRGHLVKQLAWIEENDVYITVYRLRFFFFQDHPEQMN